MSRLPRYLEPLTAFATFSLFLLYTGLYCFKEPWGGDLDLYVAALRSLYADLADPAHETLVLPGSYSHLFSPYLVSVAAVGRILRLSGYQALQYAGLLNLLLYSGAVVVFFRTFSLFPRSWYPPSIFLLVSTLLYNHYFHWSSEMHLFTLTTIQAYPSFFVWSLALASFALAKRFLTDRSYSKAGALCILLWFAVLTHPLTASWIIVILALLGVVTATEKRRNLLQVLALSALITVAVLAALIWPYTSLVGVISNARIEESAPFVDKPFTAFAWLYLMAVPSGLYFICIRKHQSILLGFLTTLVAYTFLVHILGFDFAARYIFFQAFFAQVAVSEVAAMGFIRLSNPETLDASLLTGKPLIRHGTVAFLCIVILAAVFAPATREAFSRRALKPLWALPRLEPAHDAYYAQFAEIRSFVRPGEVLLAPVDKPDETIAAVTGIRLVASPDALGAPDFHQRIEEVALFFAENTTLTERTALIEKYAVRWVLLWDADAPSIDRFVAQFGSPAWRNDRFTLFSMEEVP